MLLTLTIAERVLLPQLLPYKGDIETMETVRELVKAVAFTEDEISQHNIKHTTANGQATTAWDKGVDTSIEVSNAAHDLVVQQLEELSASKQFQLNYLSLNDKFVELPVPG